MLPDVLWKNIYSVKLELKIVNKLWKAVVSGIRFNVMLGR